MFETLFGKGGMEMLKNSELTDISKSITLLTTIKIYLLENNTADFIDKTGIDLIDIQQNIKALQQIHTTSMVKHKEHSERVNNWNKSHPEQHRKYNRDYERRRK